MTKKEYKCIPVLTMDDTENDLNMYAKEGWILKCSYPSGEHKLGWLILERRCEQ